MIYINIILLFTRLINLLFYKNIKFFSKILLDFFSTDFVIIKKKNQICSRFIINVINQISHNY